MKYVRIDKPCTENWNEMTPTESGAYCQKCCKQVIDFTNQTNDQIQSDLRNSNGEEVCAKITKDQLSSLNWEFQQWQSSATVNVQRMSFYAFLFVFGLSMVSCSNQEDEQRVMTLQESVSKVLKAEKKSVQKTARVQPRRIISELAEPQSEVIMGEKILTLEKPIEKPVEKPKPTITRDDLVGAPTREIGTVMMGLVVMMPQYVEHIEEVVPEDEYDENGGLIPNEFASIAYPNPTKVNTTIKFEVPTETEAVIQVFSMNGNLIYSFDRKTYRPGTHEMPLILMDQAPGMYLVTIMSEEYQETIRISKF
jgi:hypothetical protein